MEGGTSLGVLLFSQTRNVSYKSTWYTDLPSFDVKKCGEVHVNNSQTWKLSMGDLDNCLKQFQEIFSDERQLITDTSLLC